MPHSACLRRAATTTLSTALFALGLSVLLIYGVPATHGANLQFDAATGTAGAQDGTGTWSNGGANWRNTDTSTDNVTFANGDAVTFGAGSGAGTAGTVTISGTVTTPSITFNATGSGAYTITAGTLSMTNGTITQNVNATINSVLAGSNITKNGNGTLTLGGNSSNSFTGSFSVNAGTVVLNKAPNSDSQLPQAINNNVTVNIGNGTVQAILQLGRSNQISDTGTVLNFTGTTSNSGIFRLNGFSDTVGSIRSVKSGPNSVGIIENNHASTASTLTVNNATNETFSGIIRNAASGGAALNLIKASNGTLTLTEVSTYTGTTTVRGGTLEISGNGTINGSTNVIIATGGTLKLSTGHALALRNALSDSGRVTLRGGTLWLAGEGVTPGANYREAVGDTTAAAGASTISTVAGATDSSVITFTSFSRNRGATVNFTGTNLGATSSNRIMLVNIAGARVDTDHGTLGGWATVGNEFAKHDRNLGVQAMEAADYVTSGETDWTFEANAKITGGITLTDDRHVNSLNIAAAGTTTVNLGGNVLRVESGGLLVSGTDAVTISNGSLTAGTGANNAGELIIHQNSSAMLDITATITENGDRRTGLVKSGTGTVRLSNANSFTGYVYVNSGTLQMNHAAAIDAGNRLFVEGGTLDLNGHNLTVLSLTSQDGNTTGLITNTNAPGGAKTLTLGSENTSTSFSGQLGVNLNLTKTGTGTFTLNQSNANYAGIITVAQGTLVTGSPIALGTATGTTDRTIVQSGATLDISNGINRNERLEVAGHGVNGQGAIVANSGDSQNIQNLTLTGHTTLGVNVRYDFDNTLAGGGFNLTKIGSAELALEGSGVQNLGDVHVKQGTVTWSGSADLGVSTGTLYVDYGAIAQTYNKTNDSKRVTLAGGTLRRNGSSTGSAGQVLDVVGGLKLAAGASSVAHGNSQLVLQLNAIQRDVGATLNVDNNATLATTDTRNDAGGILGGFVTVGGADWAKNNTNDDDGAIVAYTGYVANDFTAATNNVNVTGAQTATDATVNSLRFATGASTLNLTGTNTVASGGILVTGGLSVSANISGGTLRGSENGDLVIFTYGSASATVSSTIADNGGPTALTASGSGLTSGILTLTGNNTYSGGTYFLAGVVNVNVISDSGNSNLGNSASATDNILTFNGGTLGLLASGTDSTTARNVVLLAGSGRFNIGTGRRLELSGTVSGEALLAGEGSTGTTNGLMKVGSGTLTLSGTTSNTYTGLTGISEGVLELNKSDGATAIAGDISMLGGTLRLMQSNQIADTSIIGLNTGGTVELNGNAEVIGGLSGNGLGVRGSSATGGSGTLETKVAEGASYTFNGVMSDGTGGGKLSFTKSGAGTQTISTPQTYTGQTTVAEGTLQFTGPGGLSSASNVVLSGGRLVLQPNSAMTFSNVITGDGTIAMAGTLGSVTLDSGANTYTGTTQINATVYATNTTGSATGSSTVDVAGTGVLGGTGRITGHTIVREGGQISPGKATLGAELGTLTLGDVTVNRQPTNSVPSILLQFGGVNKQVYNDAGIVANMSNLSTYLASNVSTYENEAGDHDRLIIDGTLNLDAGATIELAYLGGGALKAGDVLDLMDWLDLNLMNAPGDRAWSPHQDLILPTLLSAYTYDLSLFESNGIVVVVNVPEPGRAMLLMLGVAALVMRRRRKV